MDTGLEMKTLIFLCGYDDFYFRLAEMTAHTIRLSGYMQDIVIFTIDERSSKYTKCINIDAHPDAAMIRVDGFKSFHKKVCTAFGHKEYSQPYDYFMIKTLPGTFINKNDYDFILYMDSDMLVHSSLDPIFQKKTVVSDHNSRKAIKDVKGLAKYFTPTEKQTASKLCGIGGGSFGVPKTHYRFYDDYRKYYLQYVNEIPHDQPVLSFTMVKHADDYTVEKLPNRAHWIHYWGYRKQQMITDYNAKYLNRI